MRYFRIAFIIFIILFFCGCVTSKLIYYGHRVLKTTDLKYNNLEWTRTNSQPLFKKNVVVLPFNDLRKVNNINVLFKRPLSIELMNIISNILISENICEKVKPGEFLFGSNNKILLDNQYLASLNKNFKIDGVISGNIKEFDYYVDNDGETTKLLLRMNADIFYASADGLIKAEKLIDKEKYYDLGKKILFLNTFDLDMSSFYLDFINWCLKGEMYYFLTILSDTQKHLNKPCHKLIYRYSSPKVLTYEDYLKIYNEENMMRNAILCGETFLSLGIAYGLTLIKPDGGMYAIVFILFSPFLLAGANFIVDEVFIKPAIREKVNSMDVYASKITGIEIGYNF